ncbi:MULTISPECIES: glycosyltransferase family 4 protein [unclassified Synechococcus]|uniref:MraY family glycosyltransferase n=1 Tax=unclassified Synechococcus TaxID=2626047 RepID=UPI0020CDC352|nr:MULTISPECIES: glycosyltransferase family 4 protein [unclassified Synechococcus]
MLRALIPQLRLRLLDQPNARSSHHKPTPRGGGMAFVLVAAVASGLQFLSTGLAQHAAVSVVALPLIALPLALIGVLDDRHNLPASWRYGVQLTTALAMILLCPLPRPWLAMPLLLIAITAVINFTNFMDGLDGLVAGCMAVAISATAIKLTALWPLWALVGALLGFLLWNWSPAKVFMGDVGSTFLGAVFAGVVLQAPTWPDALGMLLLATPLLADAGLCVPRRLLAGQPVFQAHRLHLYQRLHQAGWSHSQVSNLYVAATTALAVTLLWGGWPAVMVGAGVELLVGVWLDQCVAVPFTASLAAVNAKQ